MDHAFGHDIVSLRPAEQSDADLIYSSWLRSYRKEAAVEGLANAVYYSGQQGVIDDLLKRCSVIVACDPKSPTDVLGWVCFEVKAGVLIVHYCYVKQAFRRMGMATHLLSSMRQETPNGIAYTHKTSAGKRLAGKLSAVHNPFLAR